VTIACSSNSRVSFCSRRRVDWAFLIKNATAKEYAAKRTLDHLERFERLHDQFTNNDVDLAFLSEIESRDNLFPNANWRYFA